MYRELSQSIKKGRNSEPQPKPQEFKPHYDAGVSPFAALRQTPARASSLSNTINTMLTTFHGGTGNGKWKNLPRAIMAHRLTALAGNASLPDQAAFNACGPALITHLFIKRKPEAFVQFVIDLYETGKAKFGTLDVSGDGLFDKDPSKMAWSGTGPPLVDWMVFSSLRRSQGTISGLFFDGEPSDDASAISTVGEVVEWLSKGIQYGSVKDEASNVSTKALSHLSGLTPVANRDIVLLINVSNIEDQTTKGQRKKNAKNSNKSKSKSRLGELGGKLVGSFPNHWVELEKPFDTSSSSNYKATVWTWGQSGYTLESPPAVWEDSYYGALICEV